MDYVAVAMPTDHAHAYLITMFSRVYIIKGGGGGGVGGLGAWQLEGKSHPKGSEKRMKGRREK